MEIPPAVVPLAQVRERVIQRLSEAFAHDLISVEELEGRLEQVYRAQSPAEAEALAADLGPASTSGSSETKSGANRGDMPAGLIPIHDRFVSVFSSSSRRGVWSVPHQFDVLALFSETVVDLTAASLPGDLVDMNVRAFAASVKIIVPPGLRVVNRIGALLASVSSETELDLAPMVPGSPVIRITGFSLMANVEIVAGSRSAEDE